MTEKEYTAAYKAAKYRERKDAGLCVSCGKQDAYTLAGRSQCAECAERSRRNWHRCGNDRRRDRYYLRKANGLCVDCGKPAIEGHVRCKYHAEKVRWNNKLYGRRRQDEKGVNFPRGENGLCYRCNKRENLPGMKICHSCYSDLAEARAKKKAGHVDRHPWTQDNDLVFGRRKHDARETV